MTNRQIFIDAMTTFVENSDDAVLKMFFEFVKFENVFSLKKAKTLISRKNVDHIIELKNEKTSSYDFLYNLSNSELIVLREYLDDAFEKNIIKHSINFVETSMLFVSKKNEKFRFCVDYKDLNVIIRKNRHSLSLITQMLNQFNELIYFIKIDLTDAYNRIRIRTSDEWKTTFRIRYEHFKYLIMSFDLTNVSIIFQVYVNKALIELIDNFCVIYLNDILIFSKNRNDHIKQIKQILQRLRDNDLYVNLIKCFFFKFEVDYLSFIVRHDDIKMNFVKIDIIKNWSSLKSFKNIQMFLKFINFYKRFIEKFSQITMSLSNMLKNMQADVKKKFFQLTSEEKTTFEKLKAIFQNAFILIHFDSNLLIRLKTDVFEFDIASIIFQLQTDDQWKLVAFYSRKMISAERNYEIHDEKLLTIIEYFKHWRHYLEDSYHIIKIWIDHNNLKEFMKMKSFIEWQVKWAMRLVFSILSSNIDSKNLIRSMSFLNDSIISSRTSILRWRDYCLLCRSNLKWCNVCIFNFHACARQLSL